LHKGTSTKLFLIRHGDTLDEETKKIYKGSIDIPLSEKGISRIDKVASFLSDYALDVLYTSALSRCIESGRIIVKPHNINLTIEAGLNEIGFGKWEGLSFDDILKQYPQLFLHWLKDPIRHTPPDGEPLLRAQERIMKIFSNIVQKHRGLNVAIVGHAGVLRIIIASLLALNLSKMYSIAQDYGCVDVIDVYDDDNVVIKLLNYTTSVEGSLTIGS
jgi:alpha-ribazole phosphatase